MITKESAIEILQVIQKEMRRTHRSHFAYQISEVIEYLTDKEKLQQIKGLADGMYYAAMNLTTDASKLRKAMERYHQFIIKHYYEE